MTSICEQHRAMCMHQADCPDTTCPGREMAREALLAQLQQEIADESARSDVECIAQAVASYHKLMPVYRVDQVSDDLPRDDDMRESYAAALAKAVRYLDLRQLLVRPAKGDAQVVCFRRAAS